MRAGYAAARPDGKYLAMSYGRFNNPDEPVCRACEEPNEERDCAISECGHCGLFVCEACDEGYDSDFGALCPSCAKKGKNLPPRKEGSVRY